MNINILKINPQFTIRILVTLFFVVLISFIIFSFLIGGFYTKLFSVASSKVSDATKQSNLFSLPIRLGAPIHLIISKINIDVLVGRVGLTAQGAMDAPKNPEEVAWFELGVNPGEIGSAVIAGHYGWKDGRKAVFDNLNKLVKGDKIQIKNENGENISFVVRESRKYNEQADSSLIFSSNDEKSHLNLITCGGVWNKVTKSYSQRLVVFADRE